MQRPNLEIHRKHEQKWQSVQRRLSPLSQLCTLYIPLYFHKIYKFPLFSQNLEISPYFRSIHVFCLIYVFFASPDFDHDAFMHHALHQITCRPTGRP